MGLRHRLFLDLDIRVDIHLRAFHGTHGPAKSAITVRSTPFWSNCMAAL